MPTDRNSLMMLTLAAFTLSLIAVQAMTQLEKGNLHLPGLWGVALASYHDRLDPESAVKEQETIRKSFTFNAAEDRKALEVDNVFGSIEVVGTNSKEAQLVVAKTIIAESKERLEAARKEVTL